MVPGGRCASKEDHSGFKYAIVQFPDTFFPVDGPTGVSYGRTQCYTSFQKIRLIPALEKI